MATLPPSFLIRSSSFLHVTRTTISSRMNSNLNQIRSRTVELAALERLEKTYNGRNAVATLSPLFLTGSSSLLRVLRTCINA